MTQNPALWQKDQKVLAILAYVLWYRQRYCIGVGSLEDHDFNLSSDAQMISLLARDEFGRGYWVNLADAKSRNELYAYVCSCVLGLQGKGTVVGGWSQPEWQITEDVREIVAYVEEFRFEHNFLNNPRDYRVQDLDEYGRFAISQLVPASNFSGPWEGLADISYAHKVAECVRNTLRPRLAASKLRKSGIAS